ncbi:tetratricopeptide repeat protein [Metallumcola ferriviriculae]|uniref:Tetratricopeptide repeat protein n=1 Tax=Metallumcola ferriviriculae TaxID=3039180 RepID=A0AAU0UP27_9FIRM|nr:tetratricopeptide repeat protein [Desulfitibacteraceae bacterium MK1]
MLKFFRKNNKIIFIILTPLLAVGLVLSFTIWSAPSITNSNGNHQVKQGGPPVQQDDALVEELTNIRRYEQALKANPDNHTMLIDLGNAAYDVGLKYFETQQVENGIKYFNKAVEAYQNSLEIGEADPNVMTDLATAAMYSGQDQVAEEYFKKAIEMDDSHIYAKMNYGVFLANVKQDYAKAVEQWQKVVAESTDPDLKSRAQTLISNAQANSGQ